jgi:hypothetical protein
MSSTTRKCKMCSEVFVKQRPLDMFCSMICAIEYKKNKPIKTPKPIKQFSDKRAKRNQAYLVARKVFLLEPQNKYCPVMKTLFNKTVEATEVHHTNGRENERLNDRDHWLAVSREGHQWIHNNPKESRELGWLI